MSYFKAQEGEAPAVDSTPLVLSVPLPMRGWWNTAGNLVEILLVKQNYRGTQCTGICVKHRGVRFHRIRDFKQYVLVQQYSANLSTESAPQLDSLGLRKALRSESAERYRTPARPKVEERPDPLRIVNY